MKERESENILEKAVKALNDQQVPSGPPEELANSTFAQLTEISGQTNTVPGSRRIRFVEILKSPNYFIRFAAAAVILIMAGYATGRLLSPKPPDMEQIRAVLEPEIRKNVLGQVNQYLESGLTASFTQLRDDLAQQHQRDMNQYVAYTLAASGAATNQLLEELIESIDQAQTQDRQWVATALGEIELNRLEGDAQLSNAFATFAAQTKQDMAQILSFSQPDSLVPTRFTDPNNLN
ncbi:MAG: hypothetical protein GY845_04685 [Planctomycetes bacterium]|nr:hypothetical protein [Planctomycetota bacterium]